MTTSIVGDLGTHQYLDFWTWNGVSYTAQTAITAQTNGTEKAMFLLTNPSGSSKTVVINDIINTFNANNIASEIRIYTDPTITSNGTALTVNNMRQINTTPSLCTVFSVPTVTSNGTLIYLNSLFNSSLVLGPQTKIILDSAHKLLITVKPFSTGLNSSVQVGWIEI